MMSEFAGNLCSDQRCRLKAVVLNISDTRDHYHVKQKEGNE